MAFFSCFGLHRFAPRPRCIVPLKKRFHSAFGGRILHCAQDHLCSGTLQGTGNGKVARALHKKGPEVGGMALIEASKETPKQFLVDKS
jgi:hypothetical protein